MNNDDRDGQDIITFIKYLKSNTPNQHYYSMNKM